MMKFNIKTILVPTVSLLIICGVVTALLAGTNALTADTIAQQDADKAAASRSIVLPAAKVFKENSENGIDYYTGYDGSDLVGYTFTTAEKGYGGDVQVMTGITAKGEVSGVVILSHDETPGLGANAVKDSFTSQYKQPLTFDGGQFTVIKNAEPKDGEIEALTGATITSRAVTAAVNDAVTIYNTVKEGAK